MRLKELLKAIDKIDDDSGFQNPDVIIRNGPWWTKVQSVTFHEEENIVTLDIEK